MANTGTDTAAAAAEVPRRHRRRGETRLVHRRLVIPQTRLVPHDAAAGR
jgi:hypothetical protein